MSTFYGVRLYYNTGFNTGNVPDSSYLLDQCESKDFDAIFKRQTRSLATVRLKSSYDDVMNADYACIGDAYYVITDVIMLTDMTAEIYLTLDPLLTAGGVSALQIIGGWDQRAHVSDDTPFSNTEAEPWAPSSPMQIRGREIVKTSDLTKPTHVVYCTADLRPYSMQTLNAWVARSSDPDAPIVSGPIIPVLPAGIGTDDYIQWQLKPSKGTIFVEQPLDDPEEVYKYSMLGAWAYDGDDPDVQNSLSILRSLGIESAVIASYVIDVNVDKFGYREGLTSETDDSIFFALRINSATVQLTTPARYTETQNAKAYALYNTYVILSQASGNQATMTAAEIINRDAPEDNIELIFSGSPAPNGTTYLQPRFFEGVETARHEKAVAGSPWVTEGLFYGSAAGTAISNAKTARSNAELRMSQQYANETYVIQQGQRAVNGIANIAGSLISGQSSVTYKYGVDPNSNNSVITGGTYTSSGGPNIVGALQAGANTAFDMLNAVRANMFQNQQTERAMGDNLFSNYASQIVAPEITFAPAINDAAYVGNKYLVYQITLSDNDVKRFDQFLTRFGYAVDQPFTKSDLTNRQNFNYIKTSGAQIKSINAPRSITEQVEQMFDSGVRIWHVLPSAANLDTNPIKEV